MSHTINEVVTLETVTCCNCGIVFAMPQFFRKQKIDLGGNFYCPSGHSQHFTKPTVTRLQEEIDAKARELRQAKCDLLNVQNAKAAVEKAKAESDRQLARAKNGVCPCCNRTFTNLHRHMKTKHPETIKGKKA